MAQPEPCTSSGSIAVGTTVVLAKPGLLWAANLNPGSAACSVTIYDNASAASGNILAQILGVANGASNALPLLSPVFCKNGMTVVVAGTGALAEVYFTQSHG